jgi:hypothetical protein
LALACYSRFKKGVFFGNAKCNEYGTNLGRPGIRFAATKIITKGAKMSRKIAKNIGVTAQP